MAKKKIEIQKTFWKKVKIKNETVSVYMVDGNAIRVNHIGFLMGGHHMATSHKFIPKGEIWLEQILKGIDRDAILIHESHEYGLMKQGMSYIHAHRLSNLKEARFRKSKV